MTLNKRQIPSENGMIYLDYFTDGSLCISQDAINDDDREQIIFVEEDKIHDFFEQLDLLLYGR